MTLSQPWLRTVCTCMLLGIFEFEIRGRAQILVIIILLGNPKWDQFPRGTQSSVTVFLALDKRRFALPEHLKSSLGHAIMKIFIKPLTGKSVAIASPQFRCSLVPLLLSVDRIVSRRGRLMSTASNKSRESDSSLSRI
jgi:hypothetical protein